MPTLVEVVLPEMGESVAEGTITAWHKRVGETVQAGEALVDVTTDKVDVEVPASAAGTVTKILAAEGATVKVGAPLAEIDTDKISGAKAPALQDPAPQSAPDVVFRAS